MVLQLAYVGVAVLHSGITQRDRSNLAKEFGSPDSKEMVLNLANRPLHRWVEFARGKLHYLDHNNTPKFRDGHPARRSS